MVKLEMSKGLQRKIRQDDVTDLGISTWTLIRNLIKEGRVEESLELMDYELAVDQSLIESLTLFRDILLTRIAEFDEEEVEKLHRQRFYPYVKNWLSTTPGVKESLQRFAEQFRAHGSFFKQNVFISEEHDRYVMTLDPCGTGGKLRRNRSVGVTKEACLWSWGKSGVCYYCTHCCVFQEILPIEMRGYPICVTQYAEKAENPCVHYYYKKPELIPDEYFTRIGKTPWRLKGG